MARPRKTTGLDEKIQAAQNKVSTTKEQYDAARADLNALLKEKKELDNAKIMKAIEKSSKSFDEIMAFLTGKSEE